MLRAARSARLSSLVKLIGNAYIINIPCIGQRFSIITLYSVCMRHTHHGKSIGCADAWMAFDAARGLRQRLITY